MLSEHQLTQDMLVRRTDNQAGLTDQGRLGRPNAYIPILYHSLESRVVSTGLK